MKREMLVIIFLAFVGVTNAGIANHVAKAETGAVIKFDDMSHDFGTMEEGNVKACVFNFTNVGNAPIVIQSVEEPCGCTVPTWSKAPVMPGQSGQIKVVFNSEERPGVFRRTLAVTTNAVMKNHQEIILLVKGNVLTKKQWKQREKMTKKK